jgi:hypothetical protein
MACSPFALSGNHPITWAEQLQWCVLADGTCDVSPAHLGETRKWKREAQNNPLGAGARLGAQLVVPEDPAFVNMCQEARYESFCFTPYLSFWLNSDRSL